MNSLLRPLGELQLPAVIAGMILAMLLLDWVDSGSLPPSRIEPIPDASSGHTAECVLGYRFALQTDPAGLTALEVAITRAASLVSRYDSWGLPIH